MAGRPSTYKDAKDLQAKIDGYFEFVKGEKQEDATGQSEADWVRLPEPVTLTGLALFLGFESRQSVYDYEKNEEFSYTIKRARLKVENEYEKKLNAQSPTGAIFALKNLGWKDKTEVDATNMNYNSETLTPEKMKELDKLFENDY